MTDTNKEASMMRMYVALVRADYAAKGAGFDADLIEALAARVAKAEADRDRLRAALEPFTKWKPSASWPDHEDQWNDVGLTVAHIRRARAALNPNEADHE